MVLQQYIQCTFGDKKRKAGFIQLLFFFIITMKNEMKFFYRTKNYNGDSPEVAQQKNGKRKKKAIPLKGMVIPLGFEPRTL